MFAYTETPRIWSPNYAFEISDMVLPKEIPPDPTLGERTRFEFPFNSGKKPRAEAFPEVRDGLKEISENTLLFLSCIKEIRWRIDGGEERRLRRVPRLDHHVEIVCETGGRRTGSSHFLRFTEQVDGLQHSAIAFELEPLSGDGQPDMQAPFAKRFRIVPAKPGRVAVYFTAAKETSNLHFHLHAPFVPDLSRSSIKDTKENKPLFKQLAALAAQSLSTIRDLGLLDREFLAVLPNSHDDIPGQYEVTWRAIVDAMNEQPLTPTQSGDHAPANRLLQAAAALKELLGKTDLRFLTGRDDDPDWAIGATQQNGRVDHFLRDLNIEDWDAEQFAEMLEENLYNCYALDQEFIDWMRRKPAKWHRELYAFFCRALEDDLYRFKHICIVRCSDDEYRTGQECYFPTPEIREDPIFPRVVEDIYAGGRKREEQERAREFLEAIGVREVGELEEIKAILENRYSAEADIPNKRTYKADLRRFIALVEEDRSKGKIFKDYWVLQGADGHWHRPTDLYFDTPHLDTGLNAYYEPLGSTAGRIALSDDYRKIDKLKEFVSFAQRCGVADRLEIEKITCFNNPEFEYLRTAPGERWTYTSIDRDFVIPEIEGLFDKGPNLELSRLVWKTLYHRSQDECILQAVFQRNRSGGAHYAKSQIVHQLCNAAWIPQGDKGFVRPAEASLDLLPDGFPFDPGWAWIKDIGFGAETRNRAEQDRSRQKVLADLGFKDRTEYEHAKRFTKLPPDERERILAQHETSPDLPTSESSNPDRRAERVRAEAEGAPDRATEKRQRTVSENRDAVKREGTDPYFRALYTNGDGVTICQICKNELPFKLGDGSYFFESVEFIPGLRKRHHQNYLGLCPNHAAMYMHANDRKGEVMNRFMNMDGEELKLILAGQTVTAYFTETHIFDLRAVIEVENQDWPASSPAPSASKGRHFPDANGSAN